MSAFPPKADMCSALAHVCFGPKADIAALVDHLVGSIEQRQWHRHVERFGRLEVDVRRIVDYLASIAVTSTSIIMYGQASWGTFSSVDAGMGASPNASLRHFNAS
jgi:hypothetical protein